MNILVTLPLNDGQRARLAAAAPGHPMRFVEKAAENDYTIEVSCSKGTYIRVLAEEIGALLHRKPSTVRTQLTRARSRLADLLRDEA